MPQPGGTHTYVHGDARPSTQRAAGAGAAGARHTATEPPRRRPGLRAGARAGALWVIRHRPPLGSLAQLHGRVLLLGVTPPVPESGRNQKCEIKLDPQPKQASTAPRSHTTSPVPHSLSRSRARLRQTPGLSS